MILAAWSLADPSDARVLTLSPGQTLILGRHPDVAPEETPFQIPWKDRIVSRTHARLTRTADETLRVERHAPHRGRLPNPLTNLAPIGNRRVLDEPLLLRPGDSFCVGKRGHTVVSWLESEEALDALVEAQERAPSPDSGWKEMQTVADPDHSDHLEQLDEYSLRFQLKMLQRQLPEALLLGWNDEVDLMTHAADFLKIALPGQRQVSAGFLALSTSGDSLELLNRDPSPVADFQLDPEWTKVIRGHLTHPSDAFISTSSEAEASEARWTLFTPVTTVEASPEIFRDSQGRQVFLFATAHQSDQPQPAPFLPFLRLIASLVASLLTARNRQRIQDKFSAHFSPALRKVLEVENPEQLQPTLTECTVLFCDRRGTSRLNEQASGDEEILALLQENQTMVTEITSEVFDHDGVITDFSGDGVLALWGWPVPVENHGIVATQAAASIAQRMTQFVNERIGGRPVSPIRIGISTGKVAVGNTGPSQQMHLSVFGSVVNFGARLEALGKQFHVPALISESTYHLVKDSDLPVRKLCFLRPAGFANAYPIYELILPRDVGGSGATPEQIISYEEALDCFVARRWEKAISLLREFPSHDEPAHWLRQQANYFQNRDPGPQWQGEIISQVK